MQFTTYNLPWQIGHKHQKSSCPSIRQYYSRTKKPSIRQYYTRTKKAILPKYKGNALTWRPYSSHIHRATLSRYKVENKINLVIWFKPNRFGLCRVGFLALKIIKPENKIIHIVHLSNIWSDQIITNKIINLISSRMTGLCIS